MAKNTKRKKNLPKKYRLTTLEVAQFVTEQNTRILNFQADIRKKDEKINILHGCVHQQRDINRKNEIALRDLIKYNKLLHIEIRNCYAQLESAGISKADYKAVFDHQLKHPATDFLFESELALRKQLTSAWERIEELNRDLAKAEQR